jgi:acyl carrier protein
MTDIMAEITRILVKDFGISEEKITPEMTWQELDIDSVDVVDIVLAIEKLTGKDLAREAFEQIQTVGDVVKAIESCP